MEGVEIYCMDNAPAITTTSFESPGRIIVKEVS
nr:MAG TPA: hypothetical protein [Caudoviricetes sp.]